MAASCRTVDLDVEDSSLQQQLRQEPFRFEFFQAVRLLHRLLPEREAIGELAQPSTEVVRFVANPSLCFPASEIQSISWSGQKPPTMMVNFMGLTGPEGVLPTPYTELVMERERARDPALRDFLDIFNHRITSLFYKAWEKPRFTVVYERSKRDRLSRYLLDLIGLGTPGLQSRQPVLDDSLLYYAGLIGQHPRSATALRQLLSDYFNVGVEIEQFAGAWYRLDLGAQCRFKDGNSCSEQLGFGAVVGDEVWNQQSVVRIRLGPLTLAQYLDFLPNGTAFEPLRVLTRFFSGDELDCEVQLVLKREEVPVCELGSQSQAAPQLGWVTWMKRAAFESDAADAILRL